MDPGSCAPTERARDLPAPGPALDLHVQQRQLLGRLQTGPPLPGGYLYCSILHITRDSSDSCPRFYIVTHVTI